jgi:ribosomal protein S18 acetylase RimI-like enzyme
MSDMIAVATPSEIAAVATLAHLIWREHYVPIIGKEQVDYMLEIFQSAPAISAQIANGYEYYLVCEQGVNVGYFALVLSSEDASMLLSKIYILPSCQGQGLGKQVLAFAESECQAKKICTLELSVNRHNVNSIAFYTRMGFVKEASIVNDIGGGFVMDDFKMVKRIKPS